MSPDGAQAFILINNKILLGKRSTKGLYHGLWATFGGKIERGETPSEALVRELYEELGIHIENPEWIDIVEDDFKHDIHFFLVKSWKGEITNKKEHDEVRWFGLDEIEDLQMVDIVREVINRRLKYLLLGTEKNCNRTCAPRAGSSQGGGGRGGGRKRTDSLVRDESDEY